MRHLPGLKAYHVLYDALSMSPASQHFMLARTIERVVNGFVEHDDYVGAVQAISCNRPSASNRRLLELLLAHDANPLIALFPAALPSDVFAQRWNALNGCLALGVDTKVSFRAPATDIHRVSRAGEADHPFRTAMMEHCLEWLAMAPGRGPSGDEKPLATLSARLGLAGRMVREVIELLYDDPTLGIVECAAQLGISVRTLQRHIARNQLKFERIRQAVRVTIAAYRVRTREESCSTSAHAAGFFDSAHMIHAFRNACGLTPSSYRAISRQMFGAALP